MKILSLKHLLSFMYLAVSGYLFINVGGNGNLSNYAIWSRPEFWPRIVLIGVTLTLFIKFYWLQKESLSKNSLQKMANLLFCKRTILGIMIVTVYCFSTQYLGFAFATMVYLAIFMRFLGQKSLKILMIGPPISVLIILFVFWRILYVSLPKGLGIFLDFSNALLTIVRMEVGG